jgi:hypothetical protein
MGNPEAQRALRQAAADAILMKCRAGMSQAAAARDVGRDGFVVDGNLVQVKPATLLNWYHAHIPAEERPKYKKPRRYERRSPEETERREAQVVTTRCDRCTWRFRGPMRVGRAKFKSHQCHRANRAA